MGGYYRPEATGYSGARRRLLAPGDRRWYVGEALPAQGGFMLLLAIALAASAATADALPNDNRTPAGRLASGVLTVRIVAEDATFYPETKRAPAVALFAFAE